ncbi:MAG: respiratory nitrate reductase subunit gamma [Candidatus Hatepunaea meridiana]|nr:respiratory nitrate reductase subunit gamma [Candidatus Hatepunaea meridiana]
MQIIQIFTYIAVVVAVLAMLIKALKYITAPLSFRWELYPVPHEKGRAEYGGSYLEELDWWSKKRKSSPFTELKEMASEIFFLKGVYRHNRRVWISSLPFHLGLYLCIGWLLLLLTGSIFEIFNISLCTSSCVLGSIIYYLTIPVGYIGLVLTALGAIGLLLWRLSDPAQRKYNSPADYINLLIVLAVVIVALAAHLTSDPVFDSLRAYVKSLLIFSPVLSPGILFTIELWLVAFLIMYIPLTRMSHFVAKYFLYHSVRWNDEPNERGGKIEKQLLKQFNQKVSWSASHIQSGKTWSEIGTETKNEE